jgi:two-component system response regulator YesN
MYKVILVDDEPLALEGLKLAVDWKSLGYEIVGECGDGEEALSLIAALDPDLIITDIRMPGLDGLGLIERAINHDGGYLKFIIVSGYGEFEYAKAALRFGIQHYVLKPVFQEEMAEVLLEMRRQLDQRKRKGAAEAGQGKNSLVVNDILSKILHDGWLAEYRPLLQKSFSDAEIFQPWSYLVIETGFAGATPNPDAGGGAGAGVDRQSQRVLIRRAFREMFKNSCVLLEQDIDCFGVLIGADALGREELSDAADRLRRILRDRGIDGFYIAIGDWAPDLYSIGHSYQTARQALDYKFFTEFNQVIFYHEVKDKPVNQAFNEVSQLECIVSALEDFNLERLENSIASAFAYFQTALLAPEMVKMFVINIIYRSIALIREMNGAPGELLEKYGIPHLEQRKTTLADLKRILQDYARECCLYLKTLRGRNSQAGIYRIEEYVQQNFKRNLTIKEIAKHFYMHPAYIGQLFQKKFGISFSEHLHRLRIREAENLMAATSLRSHEIAAEVGYNNYHSFLDNFKKYTGYTPADYKSRADL